MNDIDSLYTNINTQEGIQAFRNIFSKFHDKKVRQRNITIIRNESYELKAQLWAKHLPLHMQIYLWQSGRWPHWTNVKEGPYITSDVLTISGASGPTLLDSYTPLTTTILPLKLNPQSNLVNFLDTTTFKGPKFTLHNQLDIKTQTHIHSYTKVVNIPNIHLQD